MHVCTARHSSPFAWQRLHAKCTGDPVWALFNGSLAWCGKPPSSCMRRCGFEGWELRRRRGPGLRPRDDDERVE
eukprot:15207498-Alexandrium_andersonii.AAC.1